MIEHQELIEKLSRLTDQRDRVKAKIQEIANFATVRGEIDTATALINLLNTIGPVHKMPGVLELEAYNEMKNQYKRENQIESKLIGP